MQTLAKRQFAAQGPSRRATVRVQAQASKAQQLAAAAAAGVLLASGPAFAGVVLEQPQLKKVFQSDASAPAVPSAVKQAGAPKEAKAAKAEKPKKEFVGETSSEGISPQLLALPAALVAVGGGAFALTKLDAGFGEFMRTAAAKDSNEIGAGYEPSLKADGGVTAPRKGTVKAKAGTTRVKKAAKATAGAASPLSALTGLFGNK